VNPENFAEGCRNPLSSFNTHHKKENNIFSFAQPAMPRKQNKNNKNNTRLMETKLFSMNANTTAHSSS